ncbi:hypothetical protein DJ71_04885 [Halorubrum sp. E3]|nr:hypothetical protein DJ71_04885 [Halorubrum sp. E3]
MSRPEAADVDEPNVIEVPITLHRNKESLHVYVDESAVGEGVAERIPFEEIERRLFTRLPESLLNNAGRNLPRESRRHDDAPQVAVAEWYPDAERLGGVALSMDDELQWAMIPSDGGESA